VVGLGVLGVFWDVYVVEECFVVVDFVEFVD